MHANLFPLPTPAGFDVTSSVAVYAGGSGGSAQMRVSLIDGAGTVIATGMARTFANSSGTVSVTLIPPSIPALGCYFNGSNAVRIRVEANPSGSTFCVRSTTVTAR